MGRFRCRDWAIVIPRRLGHSDTKAMLKNQNTNLVTYSSEARGWTQILARYRTPSPTRGIIELVITADRLFCSGF
jgi:hypothetical protein